MSHYVEARLPAAGPPKQNPLIQIIQLVIVEAEIPKWVSGPLNLILFFLNCYVNLLFSLHFDLVLLIT